MKGIRIAGAICEIIAGAIWLIVCLTVSGVLNSYENIVSLPADTITSLVCAVAVIIGGCSSIAKTGFAVFLGLMNIIVIILNFTLFTFIGLGIFQCILLFISSILFFCSNIKS